MHYDRTELKNQVKIDLRDTRPRAVWVTLVYLVAVFLISTLIQALNAQGGLYSAMEQINALMESYQNGAMDEADMSRQMLEIMSTVAPSAVGTALMFSFISSAVNWTLTFGYRGYCLGVVRGAAPGFLKLACAFPQWGWVLLTRLLIALFTFLWGLLFYVAGAIAAALLIAFLDNTALAVTLVMVVMIAVVWGILFIALRYVMADYILMDEKVDALEAIKRSKSMMRGRKWHYFELEISFLGWLLLVGLVCVIAQGIAVYSALGAALTAGGDLVGALMELSGSGDLFVGTLAWILTLPILMWLRGYMTCSEAKFYDQMRRVDIRNGVWEIDQDYRAHYIPERERPHRAPMPGPDQRSVPAPAPEPEPAPMPEPGPLPGPAPEPAPLSEPGEKAEPASGGDEDTKEETKDE